MNQVALVTGAGTGVGKAIAAALLAAGYRVVMTGRRRAVLEQAAAELPGETLVHPADVSDPAEVDALFATVAAHWGRLDLLVNNAGMSAPATPIEDLELQVWHDMVAVNLTAAFLCTRAAFRQMKAQDPRGGRIVNNASISAQVPRPHSAPYTATKHAITGLTRSTALDGRPFDIACGQINIGNAATAMTGSMSTGVLQADGSIALEPTIDSALVGQAVAHMASLPLSANVLEMTIMATRMPFVGRG